MASLRMINVYRHLGKPDKNIVHVGLYFPMFNADCMKYKK